MSPPAPIIAGNVEDQGRLRPPRPARDLDEFLEFLGWIEEAFGRIERPLRVIEGEHFRL